MLLCYCNQRYVTSFGSASSSKNLRLARPTPSLSLPRPRSWRQMGSSKKKAPAQKVRKAQPPVEQINEEQPPRRSITDVLAMMEVALLTLTLNLTLTLTLTITLTPTLALALMHEIKTVPAHCCPAVALWLELKTVPAHCCPTFLCLHHYLHWLLILAPPPTAAAGVGFQDHLLQRGQKRRLPYAKQHHRVLRRRRGREVP